MAIRSPTWLSRRRIARLPKGVRGRRGTRWYVLLLGMLTSLSTVLFGFATEAQAQDASPSPPAATTAVASQPNVIVEETDLEGGGGGDALTDNEWYSVGGKKTLPSASPKATDANWPQAIGMRCMAEAELTAGGVAVRVVKGSCSPVGGVRRLAFNGVGKLTPYVKVGFKPLADSGSTVEIFTVKISLQSKDGFHVYVGEPAVEIELTPPAGPKWFKEAEFAFTHLPVAVAEGAAPGADAPALVAVGSER